MKSVSYWPYVNLHPNAFQCGMNIEELQHLTDLSADVCRTRRTGP